MKCAQKEDLVVIESKNKDQILIFQDRGGNFSKDAFLGNVLSKILMVFFQNIIEFACFIQPYSVVPVSSIQRRR